MEFSCSKPPKIQLNPLYGTIERSIQVRRLLNNFTTSKVVLWNLVNIRRLKSSFSLNSGIIPVDNSVDIFVVVVVVVVDVFVLSVEVGEETS